MKKKTKYTIIAAIFLIIISSFSFDNVFAAGEDPQYSIRLNTMAGSMLKGLFLYATDSTVAIYPGRWNQWKRGVNFKTVFFSYDRIDKLELNKKSVFSQKPEKFNIAGRKDQFYVFTSSIQGLKNDNRVNFFISSKTKKLDLAMKCAQLQARLTSLFHKNFYCIIVDSPDKMVEQLSRILKAKNARIGSIWFDSHGHFYRRHSSFEIGATEFSYATLKDSTHVLPLTRISAYCDSNTKVGIGACYSGATYSLPAVENFREQRMNGDSLMILLGKLLNKATVYGSESFVMSIPGMFKGGYSLAGGLSGKKFCDPICKPVWENMGKWNCYNGRANSFYPVNTISLDHHGNIKPKERAFLSFEKNKKKLSKKLLTLKNGHYNLASFYQATIL